MTINVVQPLFLWFSLYVYLWNPCSWIRGIDLLEYYFRHRHGCSQICSMWIPLQFSRSTVHWNLKNVYPYINYICNIFFLQDMITNQMVLDLPICLLVWTKDMICCKLINLWIVVLANLCHLLPQIFFAEFAQITFYWHIKFISKKPCFSNIILEFNNNFPNIGFSRCWRRYGQSSCFVATTDSQCHLQCNKRDGCVPVYFKPHMCPQK